MKRAALALALVAATSSVASAGRYLGIGIGTNAVSESSDKLGADGRSARLLGGMRWGRFSVEGMFGGFGLALADRSGATPMDAYQLSAAAKYNLPLGDNFEAYGRAGLHHTWASGQLDVYNVSGNGFLAGAGFEYRVATGIGSGSLWVDYQLSNATLSGDRFTFDTTTRQWTLGLTVAF
ncbi:MAG TPA: outer membrane beta-barrel protein [Kofleriaceae bacterium]|nr:outer membrane beta-barrel protein [Kofleriaceae bacterium]